ncbi:MAG: hypothetical protein BJ554DRAFT_8015, partial [Olpidium bornovanus]
RHVTAADATDGKEALSPGRRSARTLSSSRAKKARVDGREQGDPPRSTYESKIDAISLVQGGQRGVASFVLRGRSGGQLCGRSHRRFVPVSCDDGKTKVVLPFLPSFTDPGFIALDVASDAESVRGVRDGPIPSSAYSMSNPLPVASVAGDSLEELSTGRSEANNVGLFDVMPSIIY